MPIMKNYYVMTYRTLTNKSKELIIMIPITEEEELKLDKGNLQKDINGKSVNIALNKVICYGKIDFSYSSDDLTTIANMNWLDHLIERGITVPSDYDYNTHSCYPPKRRIRNYDTTNPAVLSQYVHACLNKPERCCIFKHII